LRPQWQEILDNLAEPREVGRGRRPANPTGGDAGAPGGAAPPATRPTNDPERRRGGPRPFGSFVYGGPGAIPANEPEAQLKSRFLGFNALGSFIDEPGIGGAQIFRNRLRLREGPGAIDAEHIGGLAMGIHSTLLNSSPEDEGPPIIEVFTSAWPRSWDCAFKLLARGGFLVASSVNGGQLEFVEVNSTLGGPCRMKNPWRDAEVTLYRNGSKAESVNSDMLTFMTAKGESILVLPAGKTPQQAKRSLPSR
jgi:hypothetical protein